MITVQLSLLSIQKLVAEVRPVHKEIMTQMNNLLIPVMDVYVSLEVSKETSGLLFEHFSIHCDHFGSSEAFYNSLRILNYFITTVYFLQKNSLDFNALILKSEDLIVINNFKIFKDI